VAVVEGAGEGDQAGGDLGVEVAGVEQAAAGGDLVGGIRDGGGDGGVDPVELLGGHAGGDQAPLGVLREHDHGVERAQQRDPGLGPVRGHQALHEQAPRLQEAQQRDRARGDRVGREAQLDRACGGDAGAASPRARAPWPADPGCSPSPGCR
jgi:hypothetical protein